MAMNAAGKEYRLVRNADHVPGGHGVVGDGRLLALSAHQAFPKRLRVPAGGEAGQMDLEALGLTVEQLFHGVD